MQKRVFLIVHLYLVPWYLQIIWDKCGHERMSNIGSYRSCFFQAMILRAFVYCEDVCPEMLNMQLKDEPKGSVGFLLDGSSPHTCEETLQCML